MKRSEQPEAYMFAVPRVWGWNSRPRLPGTTLIHKLKAAGAKKQKKIGRIVQPITVANQQKLCTQFNSMAHGF